LIRGHSEIVIVAAPVGVFSGSADGSVKEVAAQYPVKPPFNRNLPLGGMIAKRSTADTAYYSGTNKPQSPPPQEIGLKP
jgi:hypothetical protein